MRWLCTAAVTVNLRIIKITHQHKVLTTQLVHQISNLQLCV